MESAKHISHTRLRLYISICDRLLKSILSRKGGIYLYTESAIEVLPVPHGQAVIESIGTDDAFLVYKSVGENLNKRCIFSKCLHIMPAMKESRLRGVPILRKNGNCHIYIAENGKIVNISADVGHNKE